MSGYSFGDGGAGYMLSRMSRTRRQPPPHPLGDDAKVFAYGAATPRDPEAGGDGWEGVLVKVLPRQGGGGGVYMSGEEVNGSVLVGKRPQGVPDGPATLTVKLYFESVTPSSSCTLPR